MTRDLKNKQALALSLLLSLTISSCGKSSGGKDSPAAEVAAPETKATEERIIEVEDSVTGTVGTESIVKNSAALISGTTTLPELALTFKTNVTYLNLTSTQKAKYDKAVALVKKVVGTEAFRDKVLNYTYAGKKQFADNLGRTNAQIYQSILDAAESLKPVKNNTMDVGVKMYYEYSSTVGWTNSSLTYINVNTKYFNAYAVNEVAANLFHEWLHKLGYSHDAAATTKRPYSVPYAVGYMIRDLGKNFL